MEKCPVCSKKEPGILCPVCGFDRSTHYEQIPTFGRLTAVPKAVSCLQKERAAIVKEFLCCERCGGFSFRFRMAEKTFCCMECDTEVPAQRVIPAVPVGTIRYTAVPKKEKYKEPVIPSMGCTVLATGDNIYGQCNVKAWSGIKAVAVGYSHTVALHYTGKVYTLGSNSHGQRNVIDWRGVKAVAAGWHHTVGLLENGFVLATGDNTEGQCNVSGWAHVTAVAAGKVHTLGLTSGGRVLTTKYKTYPTDSWSDVVAIAAGDKHSVGLRSDGTVVALGANAFGQCNVVKWRDIVAIAAGSEHTVGLRADGTVIAAGNQSSSACNVKNWSGIVAIAAVGRKTLGIRADGTVVTTMGDMEMGDWHNVVALAPGRVHTVALQASSLQKAPSELV